MDQSVLRKFNQSVQRGLEDRTDLPLGRNSLNVAESISVDQGHQNSMPIRVDWGGDWEAVLVQQLHEEELPNGAESG